MWAQPEVELPKQVVSHAKTAPFSGVEVYRLPPLQPMATAPKAPRGSGLGAGDEGSVGIGSGRNTLQLLGPSPLPPPPRALGGPPGFLFEIESHVRAVVVAWLMCVSNVLCVCFIKFNAQVGAIQPRRA